MTLPVRILLLADSHLGFDLPVQPRVERRRRGHDFLANHARALAPALDGAADLVVHAGDVFDRSAPHESVAWQAYAPLRRVADAGVPVLVVPGNHERSRLPHRHLLAHPLVHVFDRPGTVTLTVRGTRVSLSGFPYQRHDVRTTGPGLIEACDWRAQEADVRLLCVHHCFEGATVGPSNYTFTTAADVMRLGDIPPEFAGVLTGHIHRHQVLGRDLRGRPVPVPVFYPGSIERTALAELGEPKGFLMLRVTPGAPIDWTFHELPTRPMRRAELSAAVHEGEQLEVALRHLVAGVPGDAVLCVRIMGSLDERQRAVIRAARLRTWVPATMNLELSTERPASVPAQRDQAPNVEPLQYDLLDMMRGGVAHRAAGPEDSSLAP